VLAAKWKNGSGSLPLRGFSKQPEKGQAWPVATYELEDGLSHDRLLCTHPEWTSDGFIRGDFSIPRISQGQHFLAQVGFAAHSDGVTYEVRLDDHLLFQDLKTYSRQLMPVDVDLSSRVDGSHLLSLVVRANGDSSKDSFCWVDPRVALPDAE
jgi:hypothetical protein